MSGTSLIINVYNRSSLLIKSLISLSVQSFKPDELIISDDGSEENITQIISEYVSSLPFKVIYIRQEHSGFRLAKARNNGIKNASFKNIIFCDQDLIYTQDYLRTFQENFDDRKFVVAYPIRLSEAQSVKTDHEKIRNFDFSDILRSDQKKKIISQHRKDKLYYYLNKFGLRKYGVKLRGGCLGINKNALLDINGYDEKYIGWGNEDDDLYRRLHISGVRGINPFLKEFPLHLYHEPFHNNGERVNKEYHHDNSAKYDKNNFRCEHGLDNPYGEDDYKIIELN